jgi:hypothetical protein
MCTGPRFVLSIVLAVISVSLFVLSLMFLSKALNVVRDIIRDISCNTNLTNWLMHLHQSSLVFLHNIVMFAVMFLAASILLVLTFYVVARC